MKTVTKKNMQQKSIWLQGVEHSLSSPSQENFPNAYIPLTSRVVYGVASQEWGFWKLCSCYSVAKSRPTPCTTAHRAFLSTVSQSSLKLMSIESMMPSNHLILCHPLLFLPSIFPIIRVFSNELALSTRWPKYWSFSFCVSPSYEYSGMISPRIDWFDFLAVRGSLKSLPQHDKLMPQFEGINSLELSLLYGPTFTTVHDYWKTMLLLHYYGNLEFSMLKV